MPVLHGTADTDGTEVEVLHALFLFAFFLMAIQAYIFDDWSGPMMQPEPLEALASATCVLSTVPPALE